MFQAACISFALEFVFEKDIEAGFNLIKSNLNCNELAKYFYKTYGHWWKINSYDKNCKQTEFKILLDFQSLRGWCVIVVEVNKHFVANL